jgi:hypothetical protein
MLHDLTVYFLLAYVQRGPAFIEELMQVIPNSHYVKRGTYELKKVCYFTELMFYSIVSVRHLSTCIQIHFFSDCGICKESGFHLTYCCSHKSEGAWYEFITLALKVGELKLAC